MSEPTARYDELVALLLEGELDDAGSAELAALVDAEPELRRDLRHHLELWELWSQQHAPERSADAFVAGFRTRLRAEGEGEGETFLASVRERLGSSEAQPRSKEATRPPVGRMHSILQLLSRPTTLAWAACTALVLFGALIWILPHGTAQAKSITLEGEVVCRHCILGEIHEHKPAVRVTDATGTHIYEITSCDPQIIRRIGNYCARPIPVTAIGEASGTDAHERFALRVEKCWKRESGSAPPASDQPTPPPPDGPVLFPF